MFGARFGWDRGRMHLLCVVDDSPDGRHVANVAGDIASRLRAQISVVPAVGAQQQSAVTTLDYDLLVVGPRRLCSLGDLLPWGRRGQLIKRARAPVMVVSNNAAVRRYDRVVLAHTDSEAASDAVVTATDLAARLEATLSVVLPIPTRRRAAYPKWHLERTVSRQIRAATRRGSRLEVEFSRRIGRPAKELDRAAAQIDPAIVVVGADARSAWRSRGARAVRDVLRRGRHPVVIVGARPQRSTPALEDGALRLAA